MPDESNYSGLPSEPPDPPSWLEVVLIVIGTAAVAICLTMSILKGC